MRVIAVQRWGTHQLRWAGLEFGGQRLATRALARIVHLPIRKEALVLDLDDVACLR